MLDLFSVYAALQIVLESLPISSSGHLELMRCWCIQHGGAVELSRTFEYVLHGPTLVMLAFYCVHLWMPLVRHIWCQRFLIGKMLVYVFCADTITTLVYTAVQVGAQQWVPLWIGFCVTGLLLFSLRWCEQRERTAHPDYQTVTFAKLCLLGVVQGLAGLPGISRFASTYVAGRWLQLAPRKSLFVSIMLQWPLMAGGFLLGMIHAPFDPTTVWFMNGWHILLMAICAFIAYFVLWGVQLLLERERLWLLSPYLILPALLALFWC